jgi:hypothetical protein
LLAAVHTMAERLKTPTHIALGLPTTFTKAVRYTRLNGVILDESTFDQKVGSGAVINGLWVYRAGRGTIDVHCYTVENGTHVPSFVAQVREETGRLMDGTVNCFSLGYMRIDRGYWKEFLSECSEKPIAWDRIE